MLMTCIVACAIANPVEGAMRVPLLERADRGRLRAEFGGSSVPMPPLRFELRSKGNWVLWGKNDDVELLIPLVYAPVAERCIVRPVGSTVPGTGRFRVEGIGWSEVLGFSIRFGSVAQ